MENNNQEEIRIVESKNNQKIDIHGKSFNYIKKFAFLPVLVKWSDGIYKYTWLKPYYEKYVFTRYDNYKLDIFGNIRIVEEVEWVHTENLDFIK